MLSVFLVALSLAMDAGAAAVCCGISTPRFRLRDGLRVGAWFGLFQAGMTLLGGLAGAELNQHFARISDLAAFGLLVWLGVRMILDAVQGEEGACAVSDLSPRTLAALAVATSLDALAVGVSVTHLGVGLWTAAGVIGAVAFAVSLAGSLAGQTLGKGFRLAAGAVGGIILIGIGVKVLMGR
ncbi:MAG: manganese efflux pump MntP family protein [Clostridiales bacterium]|nr:manganese efflux pump MntP family protein [Clostridiales bacterium]